MQQIQTEPVDTLASEASSLSSSSSSDDESSVDINPNGCALEDEGEDILAVDDNEENNLISEEVIKGPELGMEFDDIDDLAKFYIDYGNKKGFPVKRRSSKNGDNGEIRWVMYACARSGESRSKSKNAFKMHPVSKTGCEARVSATLCKDGKWRYTKISLDHNHVLSPSKSRYYPRNREMSRSVKRRIEMNDRVGIRPSKNFDSIAIEVGGPDNVPFLEKDCYNHINRSRRLKLGKGDAAAIQSYFVKMKADNSDFYYMMDFGEKGRIKHIFWADARSRAAYEEFGDVVSFDTTYLTNKYDMPFAPFVGVNHHGQSILLGCALMCNETTESFIWVFRTWLACMGGRAPGGIITDQDRAMQNAIAVVFPDTRHRWCLWHIMKKLPEHLPAKDPRYESMKFSMQNAVYDSLSVEEFESSWGLFLDKYKLGDNAWLKRLYSERQRWVPVFVKDTFWAGMSTTQRSESMNSFFDDYVRSSTTLKQFAEQYENALRSKTSKENLADFNSFDSYIPCITRYEMEKQFQDAYTTAKFKEFQDELTGLIYCEVLSPSDFDIGFYKVKEVMVGPSKRQYNFQVTFESVNSDFMCNCRLFEFKGIVCRHAIAVFLHLQIYTIPEKYIIRRWRKDVKRRHTKIKIPYSNWMENPQNERFDRMCNAFYSAADLATDDEDKTTLVITMIERLTVELNEQKKSAESVSPIALTENLVSTVEDNNIDKEIHSPLAVKRKGRHPTKRKKSSVEEAVNKKNGKKGGKNAKQPVEKGVSCNQELQKGENTGMNSAGTVPSLVLEDPDTTLDSVNCGGRQQTTVWKNPNFGSDGAHIVAVQNEYAQSQSYGPYDNYFSRNSVEMAQIRNSDTSKGGFSAYNYGKRNLPTMMLIEPPRMASLPPKTTGQWNKPSGFSAFNGPPTRPFFQTPVTRQPSSIGATALTGQYTIGPLQSLLMGQGEYPVELMDDNALLSQQSFNGGHDKQYQS